MTTFTIVRMNHGKVFKFSNCNFLILVRSITLVLNFQEQTWCVCVFELLVNFALKCESGGTF